MSWKNLFELWCFTDMVKVPHLSLVKVGLFTGFSLIRLFLQMTISACFSTAVSLFWVIFCIQIMHWFHGSSMQWLCVVRDPVLDSYKYSAEIDVWTCRYKSWFVFFFFSPRYPQWLFHFLKIAVVFTLCLYLFFKLNLWWYLEYLIYRYYSFQFLPGTQLIKTKFWKNWQSLGLKCHY